MQQFVEFVLHHPILFTTLAIILFMLGTNLVQALGKGAQQIGTAQVTQLINREEAVIVDVRDKSQFSEGHILGAVNVPVDRLDERMRELDSFRSRPIILCCNDGLTSVRAGKSLVKAGFDKLYRLQGGVMEWRNANLPLTRQ